MWTKGSGCSINHSAKYDLKFEGKRRMATATITGQLCRNYINGQWIESKTARIVERRNPANTDEVVARIPLSTREEMKEAIVAAKAAFPAWRDTPAPQRGKILFK